MAGVQNNAAVSQRGEVKVAKLFLEVEITGDLGRFHSWRDAASGATCQRYQKKQDNDHMEDR